MAAVTAPSVGSPLAGRAPSRRTAKAWLKDRLRKPLDVAATLVKPARPALANLASIPLHVAGLGCIDAAAFVGNDIAGLVVTGLSLIWLEHVIADEP